jgi:hypothetical protein
MMPSAINNKELFYAIRSSPLTFNVRVRTRVRGRCPKEDFLEVTFLVKK